MKRYVIHYEPCNRPFLLHDDLGFEPILNRSDLREPLMRCFAGHVVALGLLGEDEGVVVENDVWLPPDFDAKIERCRKIRGDEYVVSLYVFDHYGCLPVDDHPVNVPRLYWATQAIYYSPGAAPFFRLALEMYLRRGTPQRSETPLGGDNFMFDAAAWFEIPTFVYAIAQHVGFDSAVKCKFHQNPYLPVDPVRGGARPNPSRELPIGQDNYTHRPFNLSHRR